MQSTRFDPSLFVNPPNPYRPLRMVHGFDKFDKVLPNGPHFIGETEIDEGLDRFLALGYGGAVVNVGFRDYLESAHQWEVYRRGLWAAIQRDMVLWWYDEKGYPSGSAGGLVTRGHPEFASLGLACYHVRVHGPANVVFPRPASCRATVWVGAVQGDLRQVCRQQFLDLREHVDAAGTLRWSPLVGDWTVLYMAERVNPAKMIASGDKEELRHYVNLLDPNVTAKFIRTRTRHITGRRLLNCGNVSGRFSRMNRPWKAPTARGHCRRIILTKITRRLCRGWEHSRPPSRRPRATISDRPSMRCSARKPKRPATSARISTRS